MIWYWLNHKLEELCKETGYPKWRMATIAMQVGIRHLYHLSAEGRLRQEWDLPKEELEDERVQAVSCLRRTTRYISEE
jgi:hypothetical protein